MYDKCVTHANQGVPWCATSTDSVTFEMAANSKGICMTANKVNDCPIGFRWAYSEGTCYRVSSIFMRFDLDYFETFFVLSLKTMFVSGFDKLKISEVRIDRLLT